MKFLEYSQYTVFFDFISLRVKQVLLVLLWGVLSVSSLVLHIGEEACLRRTGCRNKLPQRMLCICCLCQSPKSPTTRLMHGENACKFLVLVLFFFFFFFFFFFPF